MGVESEPEILDLQLMRSVRSFAWNSPLLPIITERLERAESQIRAYMLLHNCHQIRLGIFEIERHDDDSLHVSKQEQSDWK